MSEKIAHHDFVEVEYTGKFTDGMVFDTTSQELAKTHEIFSEEASYGPVTICVGEQQLLPGLDKQLLDKEVGKEYTFSLPPEQAFGKRDVKNLKVIPLSEFRTHNVQPQPGLQVDVDGRRGFVTSVSGGRVIVNFNHPFAGKEVVYVVKIVKKVTDIKEQLQSYLHSILKLPETDMAIEVNEEKAIITLPTDIPAPIQDVFEKKLQELTKLKAVKIEKKEPKKESF